MLRRSFQQCGGDEVQVAAKAGFSLRVVRAATGGIVVVRSPGFLFFCWYFVSVCTEVHTHFFIIFFISALFL